MTNQRPCKICGQGPFQLPEQSGKGLRFDCANCGEYWLDLAALNKLDAQKGDPEHHALLAHFVRRRYRKGVRTKVTPEIVDSAFAADAKFPSAMEQVENLILWFAQEQPRPGQATELVFGTHQAIVGCTTDESLGWVVKSAIQSGFIDGVDATTTAGFSLANAALTLHGWTWYEEIGRKKASRIAFMAMKFGDPELDAIVNEYFRPEVAKAGFELRRVDDVPEAGIIDNRMRVEIRRSRFMVCDLTHGNHGAYWEGGFAEGLGLKVIYTCKQSLLTAQNVHFDTRNCLI